MFLKEIVFEYHLVVGKPFVCLEYLADGSQLQVQVLVSNFGKHSYEVFWMKSHHFISLPLIRHHFQDMKAETGYEVVP